MASEGIMCIVGRRGQSTVQKINYSHVIVVQQKLFFYLFEIPSLIYDFFAY